MVKFNLTTVLIAIIMVLTAVVGTMWQANSENKRLAAQHSSINKELKDSVKILTNKYGEAVSQKAAAEANFELLKSTYGDSFKWVKDHMGVQGKAVKGIFKAATETKGEGTSTVVVVDSTRGRTEPITQQTEWPVMIASDTTEWFQIIASITPTKFMYKYMVLDTVTLVPYKKGKDLYVRGISANPNTRITGLQGVLVATDPKNKRWGIGPSIQIGYDTQIRITPGLSVQYSLIRF